MRSFAKFFAIALMVLAPFSGAVAEWKPAGPIKFVIAFTAGGGADTQARLIGEEVGARKGWKFIYDNVTGKGGSNAANAVKGVKPDGMTIGMAVVETFSYNPLASKKAGYTSGDFDYLVTTAPTQMGLVAKSAKGWKSIDDLVRAATGGSKPLSIAIMSPRLADAAYVIEKKYGIKLNQVKVQGGKGSLNSIVAGDVDLGFVAGIHAKSVKSGDLVNLASAESDRLTMSPNAKTMKELGLPYDFGAKFLVFGPKGMPADAKAAIVAAITEVVKDPASKTRKFIERAFGSPPLISGPALDKSVAESVKENQGLIDALK